MNRIFAVRLVVVQRHICDNITLVLLWRKRFLDGLKRFAVNALTKCRLANESVSALIFAQRLLNAVFGLVTVGLIARCLDASMQGWYYTLLSLASLYTLFDLGLERALVTLFAKGSTGIRLVQPGSFQGESQDALVEYFLKATRWFFILAVLFVLLVMPLGIWFLDGIRQADTETHWLLPWVVLTFSTAGMLLMMPYLAFLEGLGWVQSVTVIRLVQGILSALLCWLLLFFDAGLWAPVSMSAAYCIVLSGWLWRRWPDLMRLGLGSLLHKYDWSLVREFTAQWRVAISWICAYLTTQIYTLILMNVDGPTVAGQFGLTMALLNMVGVLALSTVSGRVAILGRLVQSGGVDEIRSLWKKDVVFFLTFFVASFIGMLSVLWIFHDWSLLSRVLPTNELFCLFVFLFAFHMTNLFTAYLRPYLKEPLAKVQLMGTLIALPIAYWTALNYSSLGIVLTLLCAGLFFYIPWAAFIFKTEVEKLW